MMDAPVATSVRQPHGWEATRARLEEYFDRTAFEAWTALTSDAPVSRIRATVRAGRDRMRGTLLSWLPNDLGGRTLLDAGCGTGALAVEAARRGAYVTAVDISPSLISIAIDRTPPELRSRIRYLPGDMLASSLGAFDHIVAMDSLIHYPADGIADAAARLAARARESLVFTFAPATPALRLMHNTGKLFPRRDRAPAIVPVALGSLQQGLQSRLPSSALGRHTRIKAGFYISHGQEVLTA